MNLDSAIIFEYEQALLGNSVSALNRAILRPDNDIPISDRDREYAVLLDLKYAIENLLHWTPEEAAKNLDNEMLTLLKLKPLINKTRFKDLPISVMLRKIYHSKNYEEYIVWYDYSKTAGIGEFKNDTKPRISKNLFLGEDGKEALRIIMTRLISEYMSDYTVSELYDFFADSEKASAWIDKWKLNNAKDLNKISGLEMFHFYGPEWARSDFYYYSKLLEAEVNEKLA